MANDEKSRRPFENIVRPEDEKDREKIAIVPDHGMTYLPASQIEHGNIFDRQPVLTEEEGQMVLKRLQDEGFKFGK